jgi:FkbM family methyltransferase
MIRPQHAIRNLLRRRGYEVIRVFSDSRAESLLALHSAKLFRQFGINCVLDVGAHVGGYGAWLRNNGYEGFIVSFEPVDGNFRLLQQRRQNDSRWTAHALALGSRDEEKEINVTNASNFSSFFNPTDKSRAEFGDLSAVRSREPVRVRRLDSLLRDVMPPLDDPRIYLKLDTQGWDLEVLKGATGCIDRVVAVQSEVSVQALYGGMPGIGDSLQALRELGFTVSGFFPVVLDSDLAIIELDCVAVRK